MAARWWSQRRARSKRGGPGARPVRRPPAQRYLRREPSTSTTSTPTAAAAAPAAARTATATRPAPTTGAAPPPCAGWSPPTSTSTARCCATAAASPPTGPSAREGVARMQRDPWPPLPPGGSRAPDTPPFGGFAEQLTLYGLLATGTAGLLAWTTGQLAGLVFGHTWLHLHPADIAQVLWQLPHHWNDPALAWPAQAQAALPGPIGMYATATTVVGG